MDSGSADFWVPSTRCSALQCGDHARLGPDNSATFQPLDEPFSVTYGTGHVSGRIGRDQFGFARLAADGVPVGVATVESDDFSDETVP